MDPPPDRLRVRGEPVEAGPAGWKEPCLGGTDGQNKDLHVKTLAMVLN